MARYKAGDKVKVRTDLEVHKAYGGIQVDSYAWMQYIGKEVTIEAVLAHPVNCYRIKEDNGERAWAEEMFVNRNFPDIVEFFLKSNDLVVGQRFQVEGSTYTFYFNRNGTLCLDDIFSTAAPDIALDILYGRMPITHKRTILVPDESEFFMVVPSGSVESVIYKPTSDILALVRMGNVFLSREAAEAARNEMLRKYKEARNLVESEGLKGK